MNQRRTEPACFAVCFEKPGTWGACCSLGPVAGGRRVLTALAPFSRCLSIVTTLLPQRTQSGPAKSLSWLFSACLLHTPACCVLGVKATASPPQMFHCPATIPRCAGWNRHVRLGGLARGHFWVLAAAASLPKATAPSHFSPPAPALAELH